MVHPLGYATKATK